MFIRIFLIHARCAISNISRRGRTILIVFRKSLNAKGFIKLLKKGLLLFLSYLSKSDRIGIE